MASNIENDIGKIISELSRIDDAAANVLTHMEANKQAYDEKIAKDTAKFDKKLEADITSQLTQYEANLKEETDKELDNIRKEIKQSLTELDNWYEKNHSKVAKDIVNDFIKE